MSGKMEVTKMSDDLFEPKQYLGEIRHEVETGRVGMSLLIVATGEKHFVETQSTEEARGVMAKLLDKAGIKDHSLRACCQCGEYKSTVETADCRDHICEDCLALHEVE